MIDWDSPFDEVPRAMLQTVVSRVLCIVTVAGILASARQRLARFADACAAGVPSAPVSWLLALVGFTVLSGVTVSIRATRQQGS